jgi:CubicO group peptidase (beta-lactamase class C family)
MTNTTAIPSDNPELIAVPYERIYGVLTKTNIELPLTQRRIIGGGGLYSTAGDLANYLLAHMNQGELEGHQLLQLETVAMMHRPMRTTGGDFMQNGYGYGWGIFQEEPLQMGYITFQPRGYQGHSSGYYGYSGAMFMVEEKHGVYGYVLLINTNDVSKSDWPWTFAVQINIQDLILRDAYLTYQETLNE